MQHTGTGGLKTTANNYSCNSYPFTHGSSEAIENKRTCSRMQHTGVGSKLQPITIAPTAISYPFTHGSSEAIWNKGSYSRTQHTGNG